MNYPVQKVIDKDTLVVFTKAQADLIRKALSEQTSYIRTLKDKYNRLNVRHQQLIEEYARTKSELLRTNHYNDSLINFLGDNMALLYKTEKESDVYYMILTHHIVDVFPKGTVVLSSPGLLKPSEQRRHSLLPPDWRYLNIANELDREQRDLIDYVRLYPDRLRLEPKTEVFLRP